MSQWAFLFLQSRCTGCGACIMACKSWNHARRSDAGRYSANRIGFIPPNQAEPDDARGTMQEDWRHVTTLEEGTCPTDMLITHLSYSCMHCTNPACVQACPVGRIVKDPETGAVVIRTRRNCISCGLCRRSCPWDAPQVTRKTVMTKCDFCHERIEAGLKPACVAACPMRALIAGPEKELLAEFPNAIPMTEEGHAKHTGPHFWIIPRK